MATFRRACFMILLSASGEDVTRAFKESDAILSNPERGTFLARKLPQDRDFAALFAEGYRVVHANVRVDAFRDSPLSEEFLGALGESLAEARKAGVKVLLRFAYDFSPKGKDAPRERVLEHLRQLKPVFTAHEDVIVALEAGFIGAWGEWHTSTHGLDTAEARAEIFKAILSALPKSRMVLLRTPAYAKEIFGADPVREGEAFSGSDRARTGHHNDCFLADETDMGTYEPGPVEPWKKYTEVWTRYTAMAGETCRLNPPQSDGKNAVKELARFHWSLLHEGHLKKVVQAWKDQGAWDEIQRRLGYRLSLVEASWPASVAKGGTFTLTVRLRNSGFASLFNPRRLHVVLSSGKNRHVAVVDNADPRRWWGGEEAKVTATVAAPSEPGTYRLSLWLPDESPALRDRPEYAVRFANEDVWDAGTGENVLTKDFSVAP